MEIASLLRLCAENQASDLHLVPGQPPIMRIHGDLQRMDQPALDPAWLAIKLLNCMPAPENQLFAQVGYCDFRWETHLHTHCRTHIYQQRQGMAAAFRLIPAMPPTIEQLELPAVVRGIVSRPHGLVLVTGACGSGKSSTLAALINYRNAISPCHILTLEEPIEFLHESQRGLINQRALGHSMTYPQALKSALREDPDIIMVGEMRDAATIALVLEAAETGHLVLSSLHTNSARDAISRIVGSFPSASQDAIRIQLSLCLVAIIAQALPRSLSGGRILAAEVLLATLAVRNLIRENRLPQLDSLMQTGQKAGMHTLQQSLQWLVQQGQISPSEAKRYADDSSWQGCE